MKITTATIDKLAHLARLHFADDEKEAYKADLQNMIAFVEKLQEIDTTGIEPLLHMGDSTNGLREDIVKDSVSREEAMVNSPVKDAQYFKVPKVIRKLWVMNYKLITIKLQLIINNS